MRPLDKKNANNSEDTSDCRKKNFSFAYYAFFLFMTQNHETNEWRDTTLWIRPFHIARTTFYILYIADFSLEVLKNNLSSLQKL